MKHMWKDLTEKDVSEVADKLVLISHFWGSYEQFINNKSQLSSDL